MPFVSKIQRQSDYSTFSLTRQIVIGYGGSSNFRIGWTGDGSPRVIFRNIIIQRPRRKITDLQRCLWNNKSSLEVTYTCSFFLYYFQRTRFLTLSLIDWVQITDWSGDFGLLIVIWGCFSGLGIRMLLDIRSSIVSERGQESKRKDWVSQLPWTPSPMKEAPSEDEIAREDL
ncbi:hypothetical protein Pfo_027414 [Paulownia fortunei]|nr:hypothetical protein Pfo_027414 [Paulownia fortunei]